MANLHPSKLMVKQGFGLECPICSQELTVHVKVRLEGGGVQHVGTKGMEKQYTVNLESEVIGAIIEHECGFHFEVDNKAEPMGI